MSLEKIGLVLVVVLFSLNAHAVDCPVAKITHLQVQSTVILIRQVGQGWHSLGAHTDSNGNVNPMVSAMYSAALAAQMAGRDVMVRYPDPFDCSATNYSIPALVIRTL